MAVEIKLRTPSGEELVVEGNYAVDHNLFDKYLLVPVCSNCLIPIFPSVFTDTNGEPFVYWESRGTDEPSECRLCIEASGKECGTCGDEAPCDECMRVAEEAYMARYVKTHDEEEHNG